MDYTKHIEYFFMALVCGGIARVISYMSQMNDNIQKLTTSIGILTEKLTHMDKIVEDHEERIRRLENKE